MFCSLALCGVILICDLGLGGFDDVACAHVHLGELIQQCDKSQKQPPIQTFDASFVAKACCRLTEHNTYGKQLRRVGFDRLR
jgi:hypothetical protein